MIIRIVALVIYLVALVVDHALSEGFNNKKGAHKKGHRYAASNIFFWLIFPWILYVLGIFEKETSLVLIMFAYICFRTALFDVFYNIANGISIYFVGTTSTDDIIERNLQLPKWLFWTYRSLAFVFGVLAIYLLFK